MYFWEMKRLTRQTTHTLAMRAGMKRQTMPAPALPMDLTRQTMRTPALPIDFRRLTAWILVMLTALTLLAAVPAQAASVSGTASQASVGTASFSSTASQSTAFVSIRSITSKGSTVIIQAGGGGTVTGYQVRYSKSAQMTDVTKVSSTTTTIRVTVPSRAKYYFQVRTYRKSGTRTFYSAWSSMRSIRGRITVAVSWSVSDKMVTALKTAGAYKVVQVDPDTVNVKSYDALVIPGGQDIWPGTYGAEVDGATGWDKERDQTELAVIKKFEQAGKPILGICRGAQLLNVYYGGTLKQDIGNSHRYAAGQARTAYSVKSTLFYNLYGASNTVHCYHHEAVKKLGTGLKAAQWSKSDGTGILEAYVHTSKPCIGVQWHPELMEGTQKILTYFVQSMAGKGIYSPG